MSRNNGHSPGVRQFSSDKILKHVDRVQEWLEGGNPPPITVELDMTDVCNHDCPKCTGGFRKNSKRNSLDPKLCNRIIRQICRAGIRGLTFTGGGEPLCNPHTPAAVRLAHRLGVDIGFITNGELLTPETAEILLECCVWLRVSLDAATPGTFRKTHGKGKASFDRIVENIAMLTNKKKLMGSDTTVGVGFLTSARTKNEMHRAAGLCREMGVDYLQFRPMQTFTNGKPRTWWTDVADEIRKSLKLSGGGYSVLYSKHKYDMMRDRHLGRDYGKCHGHQFATVIAADGCMYICCHMRGKKKYCIGDLKKNTFSQIWNSRKRREVADSIDFGDCVPLCRDNTFNQVLWNMTRPREHVNFL